MTKLSSLVQEVFRDRTPVAAVGAFDESLASVVRFATLAELPAGEQFAGALWAGPVEEAAAAARALRAAVNEGGAVLLLQVKGSGPLAVVRTWLGGASRSEETVERLCGALLCAGLARPSLLVESAALTAAMGVHVQHPIM
jgi:hypothetical protein